MTFVVGPIIDAQVKEVATVLNFAAGNVKRLTNPILNQLQVDEFGLVIGAPEGLVDNYAISVNSNVGTPNYAASVEAAANTIKVIRQEITEEYDNRFGEAPEAATAELNAAEQKADVTLRTNLNPDNVLANLTATTSKADGLTNTLYQMIGAGTFTIGQVKAQLGGIITAAFQKYGANKVATPLEIFSREVTTIYDTHYDNIGDWFLYAGPDDNLTREFCQKYVKGYWHRDEIAQFPNDNSFNWSGMIAGTDSDNIFTLLGGYNCRHNLEAVQIDQVPPKDIERAKSKGFI